MKIAKITPTGKQSSVTVADEIFALVPNQDLIAQSIRVYLSNQRQGTSKTKTRSEINRTTAKWYKQKGTGRARHGSRNAPIFVGGGIAHGPKGVENWSLQMSAKQRNLALKSALSAQIEIIAVSDIPLETEGKTKYAQRFIDVAAPKQEKCLLVYDQQSEAVVWRSFANLSNVVLQTAEGLNTYQVAAAQKIIFTSKGLSALTNRLLPAVKAAVATSAAVTAAAKKATPAVSEKKTASAKTTVSKKPVVAKTKAASSKKPALTKKVSKKPSKVSKK